MQATNLHDVSEMVTIAKSGANIAAVHRLLADSGLDTELRQAKYLNKLIEKYPRAVKRRVQPMRSSQLACSSRPCT